MADRTGSLVFAEPQDKGPFLVSTRSEEEIVSDTLRNAKTSAAVAAVAGIAGVGLLVAGAVA